MHMADALVSPAVAGTMYVASAAVAAYSIKKIKDEGEPKLVPIMGVTGALVFAIQMLNFTIPGTGSSGHLCGGMLLSAVVGPFAGFISMICVLLLQCLLFADGGILSLGANVWNMAFYGCFIGALLIWRPMMKNGANKGKIVAASIIGCVLTLQLGAFSVVLETLISGITELPFKFFVGAMQPIHLAIGAIEGVITAAVLCFIHEARPEMLWGVGKQGEAKEGKLSVKITLVVIAIIAVICGGLVSHFASSNPDGLEWSMEQVAGTTELEAEGDAYDTVANIQEKTALLPDYTFASAEEGSTSETVGTGFSGVLGAVILVVVAGAVTAIWRSVRRKKTKAA